MNTVDNHVDSQLVMATLYLDCINGIKAQAGSGSGSKNSSALTRIDMSYNKNDLPASCSIQRQMGSSTPSPDDERVVQQIQALHEHLFVIDLVFKMKVSRPG
jgi:hypothetical protein